MQWTAVAANCGLIMAFCVQAVPLNGCLPDLVCVLQCIQEQGSADVA